MEQLKKFILAVLKVVWFIFKLLHKNLCVGPVWYILVKLMILDGWVMFNCRFSVLFRVYPLLINKDKPVRRSQVLNLLLKIGNTLWMNSVFIVTKLSVIIMTRQEKGLQTHIVILTLITHNLYRLLVIVPVNAKHASQWISFQRLQCACWLFLNWIEFFVIFICARVVF